MSSVMRLGTALAIVLPLLASCVSGPGTIDFDPAETRVAHVEILGPG